MTAMRRRIGLSAARNTAVVPAILAVLLAAGCGAGQHAETSQEVPAIPGVDAEAGPIALRDLLVPYRAGGYPAGSDVPLVVRMVNTDNLKPVRLTGVTSGAGGKLIVHAEKVVVRRAVGGAPSAQPVIPPAGELQLVPGSGPYLAAERITTALPQAAMLAVRFTFSTGDSVAVDVPMAPPSYPITDGLAPGPAGRSRSWT